MDNTVQYENIFVYDNPARVDFGEWLINHPDCDTVCEQDDSEPTMLVYAYATSGKGNYALHKYRDKYLVGKNILKGVSSDGVRKIISGI